MTANDTPQPDSSLPQDCPLQPDEPDDSALLKAIENLMPPQEFIGSSYYRSSTDQPSSSTVAFSQPSEASLPRKQLWVIVQLYDHSWVLEQVDGQYVDLRLARVSFSSTSKVIITPHEGAVYHKEEGASELTSIDGVAVVGEIFCIPPSPERDGIQIHARVDNCIVHYFRNVQCSDGRSCPIARHTFEASTPDASYSSIPATPARRSAFLRTLEEVETEIARLFQLPLPLLADRPAPASPQRPSGDLRSLPIRTWSISPGDPYWRQPDVPRDHQRFSDVTQEWELHSSPSGSSYALMRVDGRLLRKPLESFELQESGCSTKVVIKMLIEMSALSPMPLRGLVNCGGFEIAGVVTNVERGRWHEQAIVTIEAWLCEITMRGGRSSMLIVRPFQSVQSDHQRPPATRAIYRSTHSADGYTEGRLEGSYSYAGNPSLGWRLAPSSATSNPPAINRASSDGFTKRDCRFFEGNEYLMCGVNPCGPCKGCGAYEVESES